VTMFTLVRHSAYAVAANPDYEEALEVAEVSHTDSYRVKAAGGALFATRAEAEAALAGARGHFASLRIGGAEVFVPQADQARG
jgi:hypothetical protein